MINAHKITAEFEKALCEYTGSPYAVAVDNCSNALFLALYYELQIKECKPLIKPEITIPSHTYMSVPCEIIHAGGRVKFDWLMSAVRKGAYNLKPTKVYDSALRFTSNMYWPDTHMCLSFTGPYKHLKLSKGGAILTDDARAYNWFKKARFSGRSECSYYVDDFDNNPVVGWNMYLLPEIAARGLLLMSQFYDLDGNPKHNKDLELTYPDLSRFKVYQ
jgi:dTDP-4-amino-4,6-dideoxygalactose transaminase